MFPDAKSCTSCLHTILNLPTSLPNKVIICFYIYLITIINNEIIEVEYDFQCALGNEIRVDNKTVMEVQSTCGKHIMLVAG